MHIGLHTAQHIKQYTPPDRIPKITAVQDILELHHIVNVSEFYPLKYTIHTVI